MTTSLPGSDGIGSPQPPLGKPDTKKLELEHQKRLKGLRESIIDVPAPTVDDEPLASVREPFRCDNFKKFTQQINAETYPFDTPYLLTEKQEKSLKLDWKGVSKLEEFSGSFFTTREIKHWIPKENRGETFYVVTRHLEQNREKVLQNPLSEKGDYDVKNAKEYLERAKQNLKDRNITVITYILTDGYGDVVGAIKFAEYLEKILEINPRNILCVLPSTGSDIYDKSVRELFLKKHNFKIFQGDESISKAAQHKPELIIMGPVVRKHLIRKIQYEMGSVGVPSIGIDEYGSKGEAKMCMGLNKDQLGVFIDPVEYAWSQSAEAQKASTRLKELSKLPESLQRAILGKTHTKEAIEEFEKSSDFYFGYGPSLSQKLYFIYAITLLQFEMEKSAKTPTIFMMGKPFLEDPENLNYFIGKMKELGVTEIELLKRSNADGEFMTKVFDLTGGSETGIKKQKVRLIFGPVRQENTASLIRASEMETLSTGDQSFSASAWKAFHYGLPALGFHKNDFLEDMITLAKEVDPEFGDLFELSQSGKTEAADIATFFYRRRHDPKIRDAHQKMIKTICEERAFGPAFNKLLGEIE